MSSTVVIFGASGDLTRRKLIPALYALHRKGRLPAETRVIGSSRTSYSDEAWREVLRGTTQEFSGAEFDTASWQAFERTLFYQPGDLQNEDDYRQLAQRLTQLAPESGHDCIYYLATAPQFYGEAIAGLGRSGLAEETNGHRRVIIEKPFGTDLPSAQRLNQRVHEVFGEDQVYRIDHYLGKETVQNMLVLRFGNSIFEPIWNRNYIDHVQITVAEEVTVGSRAGYYDTSGVLRDMFQNHLLQLLMVTAMETPARFNARLVRDEKVKVLQSIRPLVDAQVERDTVRGQYREYLDEPGVVPESQTATFAAIKLWIDNWRWQGVPFYLRSGKAMSCRTTQIVIQFRAPPHLLFEEGNRGPSEGNRLVIQIQPAEGIQLHLETKVPDRGMQLRNSELDFRFQQGTGGKLPDAYQRLLLDCLLGDASLFARSDEVELAWGIVDPIQQYWEQSGQPSLAIYRPGLWGPEDANRWIRSDGRAWFDACPVLA